MSMKTIRLFGWHACLAAIHNRLRKVVKVYALSDKDLPSGIPLKMVDRKTLESLLPPNTVHQGIACDVTPLPTYRLDLLEKIESAQQIVVCLDQVTDPQNVGAILRSCAVFGAKALIMTDRHAPAETGTLAKTASGALEQVPLIRVSNLSQALQDLAELGFWSVGFAEGGKDSLADVNLNGKIALVMGSEGDGLRRLTKEKVDITAFLPTSGEFTTLNVSTATAVALYETFRQQQG